MSTTYGTASSITIPSDGDTIDAADVNTPLAAIWDQHDVLADTAALTAILVPTHGLIRYVRGYGHYVFVTSGTYSASTAVSPWILASGDGTAGRWVLNLTAEANRTVSRGFAIADANARGCDGSAAKSADPSTIVSQWGPIIDHGDATVARTKYYVDRHGLRFYDVNAGAATGKHVLVLLNPYLTQGASLTSVLLILKGYAGHAALPAMMPALGVTRHDHVADTWASLKSGTAMTDDPSASLVAYEAVHGITATLDQNNTIDTVTYSYYAIICNEGHTDSAAQLRLQQLVVTQSAKGFF